MFEAKVKQLLQGKPEELSLIYKLFEDPKKALLGFSEDWVAQQLGVGEDRAVEIIKNLRTFNIIKLGPTGLNFIINTAL
ncbi:MAG: hypothetical protein ACXQS8_06345 [Candidatus Helarchaeales archaeon]